MESSGHRQHIVDRLAPAMFALAVVFVLLLGALIVVRVDIPRVAEIAAIERAAASKQQAASTSVAADSIKVSAPALGPSIGPSIGAGVGLTSATDLTMTRAAQVGDILQLLLLALWPLFWLEYLATLRHEIRSPLSRAGRSRLFACVLPPWRLATPSGARDGCIWLPVLGWQKPGRALARTLERRSGTPMLVIALLILPVLLLEIGFGSLVNAHPELRLLLHVSTGLIWCAFAIEFCILIGASDNKIDYARRHWIDLAIILLPLISFLRSVRALRLAKLAKVQKLARIGRVYRMRGLLMKAVRALMLLDVVSRLLRISPEKRLAKLRQQREELAEDLAELDAAIVTFERELISVPFSNGA